MNGVRRGQAALAHLGLDALVSNVTEVSPQPQMPGEYFPIWRWSCTGGYCFIVIPP